MEIRRLLGIFCLLLLLAAAPGCRSGEEEEKEATLLSQEAAAVSVVSVAEVGRRDFERSVKFTGTFIPVESAGLRALVEGPIEKIPVEIGDHVEQGDLLFQIRTVDYELRVKEARSALEVTKASEMTSRVTLKDAKREMLRMENLYKEDSATEQMRDRARTEYERAVALRAQAQAAVVQAQAHLNSALQALRDCTIRAPYRGFITGKRFEEGEYARRGEIVVEIMNLTTLEADVAIPERYAGVVSVGFSVSLWVDSMGMSLEGRVKAVNAKIDPQTRTFLVKVAVENPGERLKAGLFCSGTIHLPKLKEAVAVPSTAVLDDEGRSFVWAYEEGHVQRRTIRVGVTDGGFVQVLSGLEPGEKVVVKGMGGLVDGRPVKLEGEGADSTPSREGDGAAAS